MPTTLLMFDVNLSNKQPAFGFRIFKNVSTQRLKHTDIENGLYGSHDRTNEMYDFMILLNGPYFPTHEWYGMWSGVP